MPEIAPFKAVRYRSDIDLAQVTAPPYDVISEDKRAELQARHPHNVIRLTLGPPDPKDTPQRYEQAGRRLREWLSNGILIEETQPCAYFYRFGTPDGRTSAGFVAAVKLEELGAGDILPHEKTMPGPKIDRLELMRATAANLEPLWFVTGRDLGITEKAASNIGGSPSADVTDENNVRHSIWRLDEDTADLVKASLSEVPMFIADGHHRYETAIAYRGEVGENAAEGPWDYTLALIQEPGSMGPTLHPIHRIARSVDLDVLEDKLKLEGFDRDVKGLAQEVSMRGSGTIGLAAPSRNWLFRVETDLDTTWLQLLFEELEVEVSYEHDLAQVEKAVLSGNCAFLLAPIPVGLVADMASKGKRMPPKTTLFWPKPLSGLVMRDISPHGVGDQLS